MRSGVLSDESIRKSAAEYFHLDSRTHERLYGQPHLKKHDFFTGKQLWKRTRSTPRPTAPYMAHHALSQIVSPNNVKTVHEAFGDKLETALHGKPDPSLNSVLESFNLKHPNHTTNLGMLPETAFFITELGINPATYFQGRHPTLGRFAMGANRFRMGAPLHSFYEKLHDAATLMGYNEDIFKFNAAYEKSMRAVQPTVPSDDSAAAALVAMSESDN